jgi:Glycosyltransferase family 92
MTSFVPFVE